MGDKLVDPQTETVVKKLDSQINENYELAEGNVDVNNNPNTTGGIGDAEGTGSGGGNGVNALPNPEVEENQNLPCQQQNPLPTSHSNESNDVNEQDENQVSSNQSTSEQTEDIGNMINQMMGDIQQISNNINLREANVQDQDNFGGSNLPQPNANTGHEPNIQPDLPLPSDTNVPHDAQVTNDS